jgi:hypothetical protein
MMDYVDVTPLVNPIVTWAHIAPYEPKRNAPRQASLLQTHSARSQVNPFDLFVSGSGALAPTSIVEDRVERFAKERETASRTISAAGLYASRKNDNDEIDRIAKQRAKLMAAKYASDAASAEILARLEILNRRLLERSPRVLPGQVEALESANDKLNRIRAAREERAKRLGITA